VQIKILRNLATFKFITVVMRVPHPKVLKGVLNTIIPIPKNRKTKFSEAYAKIS